MEMGKSYTWHLLVTMEPIVPNRKEFQNYIQKSRHEAIRSRRIIIPRGDLTFFGPDDPT